MHPSLTVVTLGVIDFDRSVRFYRDGLKFPPPVLAGDTTAFFKLNNIILSLYPRHLLAEDATVPETGSGFSGITLAHNVDTETEVDALLREAQAAGGTVVKPAQKVFWGGYSGYFKDPDGHLWEVAHNPFWQRNADGTMTP